MKIAILGTRGIPNYHGGFEQFAEFFSIFLAQLGHDVFVYNSGSHPYQEGEFKGVKIIHCKDPENKIGTVGQFLYDLNCIRDSRKRKFDIILQLGYTSSSIWYRLLPKSSILITNMDGLEWKRTKYSKKVQQFLKYAEKLAVKSSSYLVSDSKGIKEYILKKYNTSSTYIAYGATVFSNPNSEVLQNYGVNKFEYNILIARLEPENNVEIILDGAVRSKNKPIFLVIGKYDTNKFGLYLKQKYRNDVHIHFLGGIYNLEHLNNLRYYSNLYFHGHSVGGTNPSLLEAMASKSLLIANDNIFNKAILKEDAFYFRTVDDVSNYIDTVSKDENENLLINNLTKINNEFNWDIINNAYLELMLLAKKKQDPKQHQ